MPTAADRPRKPTAKPKPKSDPSPVVKFATVADLLHRLGDIPPDRVVMDPPPGTATEADLIRMQDTLRLGLFELIDRTLVRKPMGTPESYLALRLASLMERFVEEHDLGWMYITDAMVRMTPEQIREPDISFTSWDKRPERTVPLEPITDLMPDLTVEVLSPSNTDGEIARKVGEYFRGGVRLVWVIDPKARAAEVYTEAATKTTISPTGSLDGGAVLPGFTLPLAKLFERLEKPKPPARRGRRKGG